jgi:hypothetical protein
MLWFYPRMAAAPGMDSATMMSQRIAGGGGTLVGMIFPTFVLIFMNKPHVKAAFARGDADLV